MPKRKRSSPSDASEAATTGTSKPSNQDAINAIFRANFESKFGVINITPVAPKASNTDDTLSSSSSKKKRMNTSSKQHTTNDSSKDDDEDDDDDDDDENDLDDDSDLNLENSDSEALSDDEDNNNDDNNNKVEVVTYDFSRRGPPPTAKPSHRSFMSSKPPSSSTESSSTRPQPSSKLSKSEEAAEALNLKNDVALRNLLAESHLLDSTLSHSTPKNRHKAIEQRIIALGGQPLKQKGNVPMAIQKGMKAKQKLIAEKVKREAKENGVITDKESKRAKERRKNKERQTRRKGEGRDAGVGHSKIGKFRGGELRLSRRDVASMRA
ncbi:hypothetical protein TWF106_003583 [Orbilia oligospora]|uniref:Uncharacterized protein n=1 Tax=Orbilia oligospora TaxID=2813651 RepID=A0A6G1MJQ5_ORBOL|nr:hypothetical protein TWF106_003583 [Orbilia oligospora]KAF3261037.1 hypothetical protein TWF192_008970 [Orbilia oligospora]